MTVPFRIAGVVKDMTRLDNTRNGNPVWRVVITQPPLTNEIVLTTERDSTLGYMLHTGYIGHEVIAYTSEHDPFGVIVSISEPLDVYNDSRK